MKKINQQIKQKKVLDLAFDQVDYVQRKFIVEQLENMEKVFKETLRNRIATITIQLTTTNILKIKLGTV